MALAPILGVRCASHGSPGIREEQHPKSEARREITGALASSEAKTGGDYRTTRASLGEKGDEAERFVAPPPLPPATLRGARTLERLSTIERTMTVTRYEHTTSIDEQRGIYLWDCSGMMAWVLGRTAPRAAKSVGLGRPLARDFANVIERAPTTNARGGWMRVMRIEDARPGDVFAWRRPKNFPSHNSGHVGLVVEAPVREGEGPVWLVRIADATSLLHQDDTRAERPRGGLGRGTIAFRVDETGRGDAYGWFGGSSPFFLETPIFIGRLADD